MYVLCLLLCVFHPPLQWNVCLSELLLSFQIGHVGGVVVIVRWAGFGWGGGVAHSGQHAHACSMELQTELCGATQPVSQPDSDRIQSHESMSESCEPDDTGQ